MCSRFCVGRQSTRPRGRISRRTTPARHRPGVGAKLLDGIAERLDAMSRASAIPPPPRGGRALAGFRRDHEHAALGGAGLAVRARSRRAAGICRSSRALRGCGERQADLAQLAQIAAGYPSRERFLTELTLDPPDATSDQAGIAAARRGLSDPLYHPLRQGAGMVFGVRPERRGRLHSVRSRRRLDGGDRGRAAAALRRDDARQGPASSDGAAAFLHAWSAARAATGTSMRSERGSFRIGRSTMFERQTWPGAQPGSAPAHSVRTPT